MEKAKRRTLDEQIELAQKELEQKEARIKELKQRQRSKTDKERTHRLCRRGGLVEKLLPGLIIITDEQFETFVEEILLSDKAEKLLSEIAMNTAAKEENVAISPIVDDVPKVENDFVEQQCSDDSAPVNNNAVMRPSPVQNTKPIGIVNGGAANNNVHGENQHQNNRHNNSHSNNRNYNSSNNGNQRRQSG